MDLVKQLGGYNKAKEYLENLQKIHSHDQTEDTIVWLPRALLEYRRAHNMYEEGDKVVMNDKRRAPTLWTWVHVTNWRPNYSLLSCGDNLLYPFGNNEFRHASDAEIEACSRS